MKKPTKPVSKEALHLVLARQRERQANQEFQQRVERSRKHLARTGRGIRVRLWNQAPLPPGASGSLETGAKSLTAAFKLIRDYQAHYANWSLTMDCPLV